MDPDEMNTLSQVIDNEDMEKICAEFSRLGDKCYLENAGATLYPECLVAAANEDLMTNFYMNPHSDKYTKDCIEQIRCMVLKHFHTDPSNYTVIFTSGCTQALKLTVESFRFDGTGEDGSPGLFVYLQDNHTSALGLREIALDKNADIIHISHHDFLKAVGQENISQSKEHDKNDANTLLVYPAQSNFNGFKYPTNCIANIKNGCLQSHVMKNLCKINNNWYVLLDAASFVATNKLDLSKIQADFVTLSFYKIFGFPTGLGALLIKNNSESVLTQKKYFGGGTVDVVLSSEDFHVKREALYERLEDGTASFLSIIALKHCFTIMNKLIPKVVHNDIMVTISHHTFFLAKDLCHMLCELRHQNGRKAAVLYMDSDFSDIRKQSGIVTFNLFRDDGSCIGYAEFQHMADLFDVNVRTGCFCNSGACQRHLSVTNKEMKDMYKAGHKCGDEIDLVQGRPTGAIRVSFGYFNTFRDVDKLMNMINRCFVKSKFKRPKRLMLNYKQSINTKIPNGDVLHNNEHNLANITTQVVNHIKGDANINLNEMIIYPIKSCGAYKIRSAWKIGTKGLVYDREWMIIKDVGVCLTQKQNTKMCLIKPVIDLKQRNLILNFKGKSPMTIPLDIPHQNYSRDTNMCESKICTDMVKGYDCGDEIADWLSDALEISFLRLIRQSSTDGRSQKRKTNIEKPLLSLSNQAQYLLINKATVRWLKSKIRDPQFTDDVEKLTDRFRGNLIIDMDTELAEREWVRVIIGSHEFKVEGQCSRCQMVCIDQESGNKTVEPLRTISEQFGGKLRFGIYLTYLGTVDAVKDRILRTNCSIIPVYNDENISSEKFKDDADGPITSSGYLYKMHQQNDKQRNDNGPTMKKKTNIKSFNNGRRMQGFQREHHSFFDDKHRNS